MRIQRLVLALTLSVLASFSVLGWFGRELYQTAPPVPERVVTASGDVLFTAAEVRDGQNVWQSTGGQELGSIWGHGAYVAPDWSADWLHRETAFLADALSQREHGSNFADLAAAERARIEVLVRAETRPNTYDAATGTIRVSELRASAIRAAAEHYDGLFGADPALSKLREGYAMTPDTVRDPARRRLLTAFFFWAAWACGTERPGSAVTYSQNWPPDALAGNVPTASIISWSVLSVIVLLAGIGLLVWHAASRKGEAPIEPPATDPLLGLRMTPSMRATLKYFWVVAALLVAQVLLGSLTAHYGVEGTAVFGIPVAKWLPYAVARTWHTQLGIFWIATAWLATGLFLAAAVSGHEPRLQRAGVNFLFGCLLVIVVGSLAGQWLAIQQRLGLEAGFWFGHQGYEYVDLGRFWQLFLFVGLFLWLFLTARALLPALRQAKEQRPLIALFLLASAAIGLFYGAGLMWGRQTHLALAEYWRWWVVHLWVEGFFEVFATVAVAFLFSRMGLLRPGSAAVAVLFSTIIYLGGGVLGTFHHLYFTGTSTAVLALGSCFSALEVVPLVLVGFEAVEHLRRVRAAPWVARYRWPILCFVAVSFWNLAGAGLFGFLINTPIALYFVQGLNTTPVHGHTALFGVYGMLGIGLMLFCLRAMQPHAKWSERPLRWSFVAMNAGLFIMMVGSVLPIGLLQAGASIEHGMWYARSAEFLQQHVFQVLRWLRVPGDLMFGFGSLALAWFVLGRRSGSGAGQEPPPAPEAPGAPAPRQRALVGADR